MKLVSTFFSCLSVAIFIVAAAPTAHSGGLSDNELKMLCDMNGCECGSKDSNPPAKCFKEMELYYGWIPVATVPSCCIEMKLIQKPREIILRKFKAKESLEISKKYKEVAAKLAKELRWSCPNKPGIDARVCLMKGNAAVARIAKNVLGCSISKSDSVSHCKVEGDQWKCSAPLVLCGLANKDKKSGKWVPYAGNSTENCVAFPKIPDLTVELGDGLCHLDESDPGSSGGNGKGAGSE